MSHALDPAPDIHRIGRTSYSGRKVYDTVPDPKSSPTVWEYVLKGQQQAQQGGAQPAEDEEARKQQQEGERAKAAGTPGDQGLDSRHAAWRGAGPPLRFTCVNMSRACHYACHYQ